MNAPNSTFDIRHSPSQQPPAAGWGHTRGRSLRIHYFEENRTICSGSTHKEGEPLSQFPDPNYGEECCDCRRYLDARARK